MAMNIEQRLEQSAKSIEQSSQKAHDFAEKDTTLQTCAGSRDSLPKVSRIWQENFARQFNKHATEFQNRFAISQQSLPWQAGITISDSLQRYHIGVQGAEGYKEFLPNPLKLPFETAATLADDLTQDRWLENGVPNKHWTESKVASALEKSIGVNARIWPKSRDLEVGDVIPSAQDAADGLPITHLVVDGSVYAMSPLVSGIVTTLNNSGATIGGVGVWLTKPNRNKNVVYSSWFVTDSEDTSQGDLFIDYILYKSGISKSYPNATAFNAWVFSVGFEVVFDVKVSASKPLPLIAGCRYLSPRAVKSFSTSTAFVDFHYKPSDLETEGVKPLIFIKQLDDSYLLNEEPLFGTPDNPFSGGDANYLTASTNVEFSITVATLPMVKLGVNFHGCTSSYGTYGIGVQEDGTDNANMPKVGAFYCRCWASHHSKPFIQGRYQSIVVDRAVSGLKIEKPYFSRNGSVGNDVPSVWSNARLSESGKHLTSGITVLAGKDFKIDTPVIEHYNVPLVVTTGSELKVTKPHVEAYGDRISHTLIMEGNAVIEIDNWTNLMATGTDTVFYGLDITTGKAYLNGAPLQLGPVNGLVSSNTSIPFLYIEEINEAITDFGQVGSFGLIEDVEQIPFGRTIFIDPANGDNKEWGLTTKKPVKSMSEAIKRLNKLYYSGKEVGSIGLRGNLSIDENSNAMVDFVLYNNGFTLNSNGKYINLIGNIRIVSGVIEGASAAFRAGNLQTTVVNESCTFRSYSIITSVESGTVSYIQKGGSSAGISAYVDGGGHSGCIINVAAGSRNAAIDNNPVVGNNWVIAKRYA